MSRLKKVRPSTIQSLLNDPQLPNKIRDASADKLVEWIDEIGLEDAGEIVAFASVQQWIRVRRILSHPRPFCALSFQMRRRRLPRQGDRKCAVRQVREGEDHL